MLETRGTNLLKVMFVAQTHGLVACGTVALWHCGTRDSPDTPWLVVWMILDLGLFRLRLRFLYLECV